MTQKNGIARIVALSYMILLLMNVLKGFLPAVGEHALFIEGVSQFSGFFVGVGTVIAGIFMLRDGSGVKSVLLSVIFFIMGITMFLLSFSLFVNVIKDLGATQETIVLESCEYEKHHHSKSPDTYYLKGTYNGQQRSYEVTGMDTSVLREIQQNRYNVLVTAYPNSKAVTKIEICRSLEEYANSISTSTLEQYTQYPTDDEFARSRLFLMAKDEEQSVTIYGVHQGTDVGCLVQIKDCRFYSGIDWFNQECKLPELVCRDFDGDNMMEAGLVVTHKSDIAYYQEIYILDWIDGEWRTISFEEPEYYDILRDRILHNRSDDGQTALIIDNEVWASGMFSEGEKIDVFYSVPNAQFDLEQMRMRATPYIKTNKGRTMDYGEVEFQLQYKNGKITILKN